MTKKFLLPHSYVPCTCELFSHRPHCGVIDSNGFLCSLSPGHPIHMNSKELPVEQAAGRAA